MLLLILIVLVIIGDQSLTVQGYLVPVDFDQDKSAVEYHLDNGAYCEGQPKSTNIHTQVEAINHGKRDCN